MHFCSKGDQILRNVLNRSGQLANAWRSWCALDVLHRVPRTPGLSNVRVSVCVSVCVCVCSRQGSFWVTAPHVWLAWVERLQAYVQHMMVEVHPLKEMVALVKTDTMTLALGHWFAIPSALTSLRTISLSHAHTNTAARIAQRCACRARTTILRLACRATAE